MPEKLSITTRDKLIVLHGTMLGYEYTVDEALELIEQITHHVENVLADDE
jgi:hypothetical protein